MNLNSFSKFLATGILSTTISNVALGQYKTAPCKASGFVSQTCLVKEFSMSEEFYGDDFSEFRDLARKYPNLPWMEVLDGKKSLIADLSQGANSVPREQRGKFIDLVERLKNKPNVSDLLEATEIYMKTHPSERFYFSNSDSKLVERFADGITGSSKQPERPTALVGVANRCIPNQQKYTAIMDDKFRCGGPDMERSNADLSLYTVLAEIAACEKYGVEQIGVVQTVTFKGLSLDKPCVVSLKGSSANIGAGHIDIKANGKIKSIDWTSGYDLFDKKNGINYWRTQLLPQVEKIFVTPQDQGRQGGTSVVPGAIK